MYFLRTWPVSQSDLWQRLSMHHGPVKPYTPQEMIVSETLHIASTSSSFPMWKWPWHYCFSTPLFGLKKKGAVSWLVTWPPLLPEVNNISLTNLFVILQGVFLLCSAQWTNLKHCHSQHVAACSTVEYLPAVKTGLPPLCGATRSSYALL